VIQIRFGSGFTRFDIQPLRPIESLVPYGVRVTLHDVAIVGSAAVLVVGLHVLLQYTDLGRKMRAMADNPDLARVSGIRTKRVKLWTWVIGAGLAGAGGVFLGLFNQLSPRMGFNLLLVIFAAVILGGIGRLRRDGGRLPHRHDQSANTVFLQCGRGATDRPELA